MSCATVVLPKIRKAKRGLPVRQAMPRSVIELYQQDLACLRQDWAFLLQASASILQNSCRNDLSSLLSLYRVFCCHGESRGKAFSQAMVLEHPAFERSK